MLILEGPDGSGKTTLLGRLQVAIPELKLVSRAVNSDMEVLVQDLRDWTEEALKRGRGPYLYDRFNLFSEPIYGSICRGQLRTGFATEWFGRVWSRLLALNPVVVICLPPWAVVKGNTEHQPKEVQLKAQAIYELYVVLAEMNPEFLRWDYTSIYRESAFNRLVDHVREALELGGS